MHIQNRYHLLVVAGIVFGLLGILSAAAIPDGSKTTPQKAETTSMIVQGHDLDAVKLAVRSELGRQVTYAVNKRNGTLHPLGRWLTSDLVMVADRAVDGNARRAAALLGMAETTYRRQLDKARQETVGGQTVRSDDWSAMELAVTLFVHNAGSSSGKRLVDQASQLLLEQILLQLPDNDTLGSALLGVTKPTFLRRKASFQKQQGPGSGNFGNSSRASSSRQVKRL